MNITGEGKTPPVYGDGASPSLHPLKVSSDVEKKPDRLADDQATTNTLLAINATKRGWAGGPDFSTSPQPTNLPADLEHETHAAIAAAPTVFETWVDTGQAAMPWTLSIIGHEGATLAGPDASTVKVCQTATGVFNVTRLPRTFHEQLVTRQKNEPLQKFESRSDFLARLKNFEGPLEAVLCLCKNWQRKPNTNEILMRGDISELQALWNSIAPTDTAIAEMRHRLQAFEGIGKTMPTESACSEASPRRLQKRVHDQMDTQRATVSDSPSVRAKHVRLEDHAEQADADEASMRGAAAGQHPPLETIEFGARDAQQGLVLQPRLAGHATVSSTATPEAPAELMEAWTAIDAIRRIWPSSRCSDHLIGSFIGMGPTQVSTIFGRRTSIPPPEASQRQQRVDMNLDGLVAAIRQGKGIGNFPAYMQLLAPLQKLIAMDNKQRESFRKMFHNG